MLFLRSSTLRMSAMILRYSGVANCARFCSNVSLSLASSGSAGGGTFCGLIVTCSITRVSSRYAFCRSISADGTAMALLSAEVSCAFSSSSRSNWQQSLLRRDPTAPEYASKRAGENFPSRALKCLCSADLLNESIVRQRQPEFVRVGLECRLSDHLLQHQAVEPSCRASSADMRRPCCWPAAKA